MVQPGLPASVSQVQGIQTRATMYRSDGLFPMGGLGRACRDLPDRGCVGYPRKWGISVGDHTSCQAMDSSQWLAWRTLSLSRQQRAFQSWHASDFLDYS